MESKKYSLNLPDLLKVLDVVLWHAVSAIVAIIIVLVGKFDFGAYAVLLPLINAGLYAVKRFVDGKKSI